MRRIQRVSTSCQDRLRIVLGERYCARRVAQRDWRKLWGKLRLLHQEIQNRNFSTLRIYVTSRTHIKENQSALRPLAQQIKAGFPAALAAKQSLRVRRGFPRILFPCRVVRLCHQECRVGSRSRAEFLGPSIAHFGDVDVSFLVYANLVDAPHTAGINAEGAPGI